MTEHETQERWLKSSLCGPDAGCVEIRYTNGEVHIRNSRRPLQGQVHFTMHEWGVFLGGVARGEFSVDRLLSLQGDQAASARHSASPERIDG